MSRYRRWGDLLELLAADGQLQVGRAAQMLGVSAARATVHHEGEASTNRLMAERASQVMVTADSSKVGRRAFARICTAAEVDILVTDTAIAPADAAKLADAGVKVVTA